ncbi:MAG: hypothetical protein ACI9R3_005484 [Verrucomicrobiales bacterium]|jgi:hypothetical protein
MIQRISMLERMLKIAFVAAGIASITSAQSLSPSDEDSLKKEIVTLETGFQERVQPLLKEFCFKCHDADKQKSGIRLDRLNGGLADKQLFLLRHVLAQLEDEAMPPEEEAQPTDEQRKDLVEWIGGALHIGERKAREKNGTVRRLTVAQYRNTLRDLLQIEDPLTDVLPPDGVSKDGFLNNGETMLLTPSMMETYFSIAEKALALSIVDESAKPKVQKFRVELGKAINPAPYAGKLVLNGGRLFSTHNYIVNQPIPQKPFAFEPVEMKTHFKFIEGYNGNPTVRGWRNFESIYHSVFAVRIGKGYSELIGEGLLLKPAPPGSSGRDKPPAWGSSPTFTIPVRELPDSGRFRITVEAARHDEPAVANRVPNLGVHLGLRRDCGLTLTRVGKPQPVATKALTQYHFDGVISEFPNAEVEENNVNYLAGLREIAVRSECTDGREMPRLLIRSVEFEGPFYEQWPPSAHRSIFFESTHRGQPEAYASEVIERFATRAFRRPIDPDELQSFQDIWSNSFAETQDFKQSSSDSLVAVLTSPQFLFLIEDSTGPEAEPLSAFELASKLSYFLWNSAPDSRLLELASQSELLPSLDSEIDRMVADSRFDQFVEPFASQWFSLDKFDVVALDHGRYPTLTLDAREHLRSEPIHFLKHLIQHNLPLSNLVQSDIIVANEVVASYYGVGDKTESGFEFVPVLHENENLGGILTHAAILSGLSDGRESNPVKRGAWLARKIVAEPPEDPPPNVPALPDEENGSLTLREKLEQHRTQKGCVQCHLKIDPWGLPLEQFDAGGLFKEHQNAEDARSTLPDKTEVTDTKALKAYLANERIDQIAFSFLKHIASYATGRSLNYNEIEYLKKEAIDLKPRGYLTRDLLHFVIRSPLFLEK